jgi:hypothetical protein
MTSAPHSGQKKGASDFCAARAMILSDVSGAIFAASMKIGYLFLTKDKTIARKTPSMVHLGNPERAVMAPV